MNDDEPIKMNITFRDEIAMRVLSSLILSEDSNLYSEKKLCEHAYEFADELVKIKSKPLPSRYGKKK